ncbi:hypothetical protein Bca4012_059432 [Brassica carinata]
MAEVAVALLPFAVERLWKLLVRETERSQGVGEQFEGLKNDVDMLRCFLKDAEAKKHAKSSSNIVKRFAYVTVKSIVLGFDMKTIRKRISKVIRDMRNVEILVGYLLEEDGRQVFAITGMGGIGKTTLARNVFNHEKIKSNFPQGLAWVCVSQQFKKTQKVLIVIDDIWKEGDWDLIKPAFLPRKGWKVLLTSRNEKVALHADKQCVTLKPECLTFEESWDLFQRIAFPIKDTSESKIEEDMKEIGKEMLKHCGGLPLAIKLLGGLLATKYTLKGMDFDGASIREVADGYIEELVKRNMIISKRDVDTSRFETLQLHDMMREVCLRKAEEENFVQTIDTSAADSESPCNSRRLAVVRSPEETFNVDMEVKNPSLRTLLLIGNGRWKITSLLFTRYKLMRVLDLSYVWFEGGKVPSSIGKLIHLRYLSLKGSHVTQLPSSMRNLKKLLYLNLYVLINSVYKPNIFNEMRDLAFLCLPESLDETKLELGNLVKLETLENFSTKHGRVTDLQGMTRLRSLSISITDERYSIETLSSSLSKLSHLERLTIYNNEEFYNPTNDDEEGFVWDFVNLKQLALEIYMPRLPDAQRFPSHLTTIYLQCCRLKEDPMPILEKLLHLKEIFLYDRSFSGRRMVCSTGGFRQLQKLVFYGLKEWEEWIVEEGSMPLLHSLEIRRCPKLKELPDGLRFITSLKSLSSYGMASEQKNRLLKGGKDYYKVQHIPSIKFQFL